MSDPPAIHLQRAIADWCSRSDVADVATFSAALRGGLPLERFGLSYAPWLHAYYVDAAIERRDRAIAELGKLLPQAGVERTLVAVLAAGRPIADPTQEALRQEVIAAQNVIYPHRTTHLSRATIRRARSRYGGEMAR